MTRKRNVIAGVVAMVVAVFAGAAYVMMKRV